ncbi:MerR family transcriptional regulator [Peribacillus frigoritolerans]|uniref:MerR family transcriptional regulator n=1 Tax=Peribacillus frigoritolerans TaxID=450367 RepID=UPI002280E67B|nr:MerR family transcriptional regulator [Peribacillus frigoritolerans]MCY9002480.1 MerR family transcriptional regulator [Peribacillus frigoritolerans]
MYTIGETAKLTGFSTDTLRFYEKIGLIPFAQRTDNGLRTYNENDVHILKFLNCLKQTGLSLEDMAEFVQKGQVFQQEYQPTEETYLSLQKRIEILSKHLKKMQQQREDIDKVIRLTENKLVFL